ncbi:hypothetical protein U8M15_28330, partial [Klebsiella pneumoniae]|uniref:hypothetical protein n=1 Tax=Klebsiella pneumoniae TaxID=573 RepID=UPI002AE0879C
GPDRDDCGHTQETDSHTKNKRNKSHLAENDKPLSEHSHQVGSPQTLIPHVPGWCGGLHAFLSPVSMPGT